MTPTAMVEAICQELVSSHGVHTILLYGSHADGTATDDSDLDIAAFGTVVQAFRIARQEGPVYLDVWVYPEADLSQASAESLRLRGSQILLQRGALATTFLDRLDALYRQGPERLSANEVAARDVWAHKMLARSARGDAEAHYRRVWLLQALLEDYFHKRGLWFEGPKKALRWLQAFDRPAYEAYCLALEPGASQQAIADLVRLLAGQGHA
ncbi:nucleotidyltransferase domain-containing protein [Ideonella alba]|uniref:Nucleotidyltransferase domain-containing protein n=1 Tax=Ideonella alba TaxID=2824118 RepID=A0A941BGJ4_9BURK|nr:nucleotidyltransferase domain-containing protein [Ideonella alba]MBQ0930603.1 nucleotidyltransferase domain-containing protein [Ideonella alba]